MASRTSRCRFLRPPKETKLSHGSNYVFLAINYDPKTLNCVLYTAGAFK